LPAIQGLSRAVRQSDPARRTGPHIQESGLSQPRDPAVRGAVGNAQSTG